MIIGVNAQICGENELYSECGTDCQRTCDHVGGEPIMCNHRCALGCFCSNGYVRKSDANSLCVKESECYNFQKKI